MLKKLMVVIVGLLAFASAQAQVVLPFYDGFEYAAGGNLAGNGSWVSAATTIKVNAANLGYAGLQTSSGYDVTLIPGSSAGRTYLNFASQTSGTVYFSFLLKVNIAPSAQRLIAYAYSTTASSSTPYLGVFVTSGGQLAVGISTSSPQFTSSGLTTGTTYLVVIAYTFGATDSAQIWINPASLGGSAPAVTGSFTSSTHNSALAYLHLNTPSAGTGGGSYELDELRIGSTWAEVTPTGGPVVNTPPVANADTISRAKGLSLKMAIASLLANDTDADGNTLTFAGVNLLTTNGVTLTTNSTHILYENSRNVSDSFTYTISDGQAYATGAVFINLVTNPAGLSQTAVFNGSMAAATFGGIPGYQYEVQRSTNLAAWSVLLTTNAPPAGMFRHWDNFSDLSGVPPQAYYRLRWLAPDGGGVSVPPAIATQPQSLTVTQGQSAVFSVSASGDAPLAYQWFFNGSAKSGATSSGLTLNNVQSTNAGNYQVVVTNTAGSVTSAIATLTVNVVTNSPPSITTQPQSQTVTVGGNATFSVVAGGTAPLSYQWFYNNAAQSGATSASLALTSVTTNQAGNYFVRVTNSVGAVTSSVATLTVNPAPTGGVYYVATNGSDSNPGTLAAPFATLAKALSVMASGNTIYMRGGNYFFTAQVKPNLAGTAANYCKLWAYPGEKPVLDFSGTPGGTKALYLSKDYWHVKGLEIAYATDNGIIVAGCSSNIVEGCVVHDCNNDGIRLGSSSAAASYTLILNCDSYRNFQASSGGNNGDGFASKVGTGPGNVFRGCRAWHNSDDGWDFYDNDVSISLEDCIAYANGLNLWGVSGFSGNGNGFKLGGAGTLAQHTLKNCLAIQNVHDGFDQNYNRGGVTIYNCTAYGNGVNYQFPDTALVGVDVFKNNVALSGAMNINAAAQLTSNSWQHFTVTAVDFQSLATATVTNARNADYSLLELPLLRLASGSQLIDKGVDVGLPFNGSAPDLGAYESSGSSSPVAPTITTQPQGQTPAAGQNVTFTVAATGTAPLSYQWFFNNAAQSGATSSSFALTGVTTNNSGSYFVRVTNIAGVVTSSVVALTVTNITAPPTITTQPQSHTTLVGGSVSFTVAATGTTLLRYQWYFNTNTPLAGATNATLALSNVSTNDSGVYSVTVTNIYGGVTSAPVTLTVNLPVEAAVDFSHVGFGNNLFTVTGGAGGPTVYVGSEAELQSYADVDSPYIIFITNSFPLTSMDTHIRANKTVVGLGNITLSGGGLYLYNAANVIIRNLTITSSTEDNIGIHYSENIWIDHCTLMNSTDGNVDITQESDNITISWCRFYYTVNEGHNFVNLIGSSDSDSGNYRVTFHHNWWDTSCVERMPSVRFGRAHVFNNYFNAPGNNYCTRSRIQSECRIENNFYQSVKNPWEQYITSASHIQGKIYAANNNVPFLGTNYGVTWTATTTNGDGTIRVMLPGTDTVFDPPYVYSPDAAANVPYLVTNYAGANVLTWAATNWLSTTNVTGGATTNPPAITTPPASQTVGAGANATFTVGASGTAPLRYQWFFNNAAQSGATNPSLSLLSVTTNQSGNYFVRVTNVAGAVTSSVAALTVTNISATPPAITTQPTNQTVAAGGNATFTIVAGGTAPLAYQWFFNSAAQSGATNATISLTSVTTNQAGSYFVRVTNTAGAVTSSVAALTVTNVLAAPTITTPPASQTVAVSNNATFTVVASGTAPLAYQWFFNSASQSGATNPSFTLTSVTTNQAGNYSVRVTNSVGAVTSSLATLTVNVAPSDGDYYVATNGSDSNPGTLAAPFATLPKAISNAVAGKTIYVRGGTHFYSSTIRIEKSGTSNAPIKLFAYPGEQPVLNFTNQPYGANNRGILITTAGNWWQFKGLEICYAGDNGIKVEGSYHRFEQCVFHHNGDTGLQIGFGHTDVNPGGLLAAFIEVINCDSYLNYDKDSNGGDADGFAAKMHCGQGIVFTGCRAWTNSDDGWDLFETDYGIVISNCWTWGSGVAQGNGNGFKLGGNGTGGDSKGVHTAIRCVTFGNKVNGFTQNSHKDGLVILHSLSYSNGTSGYNYFMEGSLNSGKQNVFKNNVGIRRNPASSGNNFIEDNNPIQQSNTWNLAVTANAADYINLSVNAALAPRQADGSLPEGFARLVAGSDLIDKGVGVGLPFNGSAPDLGPYEYPP